MASYDRGRSTIAKRVRTNIAAAQRARSRTGSSGRGSATFRASPKPPLKVPPAIAKGIAAAFAPGGRFAPRTSARPPRASQTGTTLRPTPPRRTPTPVGPPPPPPKARRRKK